MGVSAMCVCMSGYVDVCVGTCLYDCVHGCVCMECVRACVRACVCACVRVCVECMECGIGSGECEVNGTQAA